MTDLASSPAETQRRGRPRAEHVEPTVREAAIELLGEVGLAALSMDQLAARAGVSKATIYRRWSSKEEVVLDAISSAMASFEAPDLGSFQLDLDDYVMRLAERMRTGSTRDLLPHLITVAATNPALASALDRYVEIRHRPLRAIVDRGRARGEVRADVDTEIVVDLVLGAVMQRRLFADTVYTDADAAALVAAVLRAVGA